MSTKALKKELMAAVAMMLVAVIALSGSTFAWFASNNKVEAKGMAITAVTEGANLEISFDKDNFTAGTIKVVHTDAFTDGPVILKPTHYVTAEDAANTATYKVDGAKTTFAEGDWAHAFSASYAAVATEDTYKEAEKVAAVVYDTTTTNSAWAMIVPVYLRLNEQSKMTMTNITASAVITWSTQAGVSAGEGMSTAGRVALYNEAKSMVEILKDGDSTTANVCENITVAGDSGIKTVYAVIYFDGDDPTCTSEKFSTDNYVVDLTFAGTEGAEIH